METNLAVNLRPMRADEYADFCDYFVEDYGREIADNYGNSLQHGRAMAQADLDKSFPQGPSSSDQTLLCIDALLDGNPQRVGYLWHNTCVEQQSTFICDFYIAPGYRSLGYGRTALKALERSVAKLDVNQIKLRVAYHNRRALALYQQLGFHITGLNMAKPVEPSSCGAMA